MRSDALITTEFLGSWGGGCAKPNFSLSDIGSHIAVVGKDMMGWGPERFWDLLQPEIKIYLFG